MEYYVYIIYSSSRDKYYTGYSQDPEERMIEHNSGATASTRTGRPWTLVYKEKYLNKTTALKRENQIKRMKSRKYIESLINSLVLCGFLGLKNVNWLIYSIQSDFSL